MKLSVHHDATGAIHSIVTVNAPKQFHAMLTPKAGLLVAEVEGTQIAKPGASVEELLQDCQRSSVVTPKRVKRLCCKS